MTGWIVVVGVIALIVGVVLMLVARHYGNKAAAVRRQGAGRIGDLLALYQAVRAEADAGFFAEPAGVSGAGTPLEVLTSPFCNTPCLAYESTIYRKYETTVTSRDSQGKEQRRTEQREEQVSSQSRRVRFTLTDPSGSITVDPEDAELYTRTNMDEFRPEGDASPASLLGALGGALTALAGGNRTLGYRYVEKVTPTGETLLVLGQARDDQHGALTLGKPSEGPFIISLKSREQLLSSYRSTETWTRQIGIGSLAGGVALVGIGLAPR